MALSRTGGRFAYKASSGETTQWLLVVPSHKQRNMTRPKVVWFVGKNKEKKIYQKIITVEESKLQ